MGLLLFSFGIIRGTMNHMSIQTIQLKSRAPCFGFPLRITAWIESSN